MRCESCIAEHQYTLLNRVSQTNKALGFESIKMPPAEKLQSMSLRKRWKCTSIFMIEEFYPPRCPTYNSTVYRQT